MKRILLALITVLAFVVAAIPASADVERGQPRIAGGTGAAGNPAAVMIVLYDGTDAYVCSAAMWRPRLLLTAAHCTIDPRTGGAFAETFVFPPGSGLSRPTDVRVVQAWRVPGYAWDPVNIAPDDLAVLQLDRDLAPAAFARLATSEEMSRWADEDALVEHVGYGMTSPTEWNGQPMTITLPLVAFTPTTRYGMTFVTAGTTDRGLCPGDSGSPVFRHDTDGSYKLLGIISGGEGPCSEDAPSTSVALGFFALGYASLLNPALVAAGYAPIPGAPADVTFVGRNRVVTVAWQPPATAPETITGYEVIDAQGTVVCSTTATTCAIADLADGQYAYAVRSRNADAEGDASPPTALPVAIAGPTQLAPPTVTLTHRTRATFSISSLALTSSAVVTQYVVRGTDGRTACTLSAPDFDPAAPTVRCRATLKGSGAKRFTVQANTEMGPSPVSLPSRPVRVG